MNKRETGVCDRLSINVHKICNIKAYDVDLCIKPTRKTQRNRPN